MNPPRSTIHVRPTNQANFWAIRSGLKRFELVTDPDAYAYAVGDYVAFRELDSITGRFTGNTASCVVTYKTQARTDGINPGYGILGLWCTPATYTATTRHPIR